MCFFFAITHDCCDCRYCCFCRVCILFVSPPTSMSRVCQLRSDTFAHLPCLYGSLSLVEKLQKRSAAKEKARSKLLPLSRVESLGRVLTHLVFYNFRSLPSLYILLPKLERRLVRTLYVWSRSDLHSRKLIDPCLLPRHIPYLLHLRLVIPP